ncbi:MAG: hypothetical protein ABI599_14415 [Flavobacteriales bacterium]
MEMLSAKGQRQRDTWRSRASAEDWLRDFKAYTAKRLLALIADNPGESRREWLLQLFRQFAFGSKQNKTFVFWRKDSHPVELWGRTVTEQKIAYIHNNPVEAGMVSEGHHYLLSSAHLDGPLVLNGYLERREGLGYV